MSSGLARESEQRFGNARTRAQGGWRSILVYIQTEAKQRVTTSYILQRNVEAMSWKVGEAKGVLQMSNLNAISKTRRLLKGWRHGMSNARMILGWKSRKS